jgi:hypothetical protein
MRKTVPVAGMTATNVREAGTSTEVVDIIEPAECVDKKTEYLSQDQGLPIDDTHLGQGDMMNQIEMPWAKDAVYLALYPVLLSGDYALLEMYYTSTHATVQSSPSIHVDDLLHYLNTCTDKCLNVLNEEYCSEEHYKEVHETYVYLSCMLQNSIRKMKSFQFICDEKFKSITRRRLHKQTKQKKISVVSRGRLGVVALIFTGAILASIYTIM